MNRQHDGTAIRCSCCQKQKFGEVHDGGTLEFRRNGHRREMDPREMLARMAGTLNGSAIQAYVRGVVG